VQDGTLLPRVIDEMTRIERRFGCLFAKDQAEYKPTEEERAEESESAQSILAGAEG
jgi:hypothetical protein